MSDLDNSESTYREKIVEHSLATKLLLTDWRSGAAKIDILKPEIDRFGYDLLVIRGSVRRFLQIKSSTVSSSVGRQSVHLNLLTQADGCVIWVVVAEDLSFHSFRVIIPPVGESIGEGTFKVATHSKRNAQGKKTERPNIRTVPKAQFKHVKEFDEVFDLLFPTR